jgi:hypothetical protein
MGGPRRLSQSFLGAGLPLSPPVLKQQPQQTAAVNRRRGHTAQTERKPQAAAEGDATINRDAQSQSFGQVLWPLREHTGSAGAAGNSSSGGSRQANDFVPSQRRPKGATKDAAGTGGAKGRPDDRKKPAAAAQPKPGTGAAGDKAPGPRNAAAAAVRATAPPKATSSRTFARQRQQLAQDLYTLWNAQVGW